MQSTKNCRNSKQDSGLNAPVLSRYLLCDASLETCNEFQTPPAISFIDLTKAFDSIHRPSLWNIRRTYDIPPKVISAIEKIYADCKCCIRTEDGYSGWFEVVTGVRQGCLLSPILFSLAIDWVLKKATKDKGIQWLEGQKMSDLDFADDNVALTETTRDLQSLVSEIGTSAASIGLNISAKKTKNMLAGTHPPPTSVYIDQKEVEVVDIISGAPLTATETWIKN